MRKLKGLSAGYEMPRFRLMSDCRYVYQTSQQVDSKKRDDPPLKNNQESTGESLYVCEATRNVLNRYQRAGITRCALFRPFAAATTSSPNVSHLIQRRLFSEAGGYVVENLRAVPTVGSALARRGLPLSICKLLELEVVTDAGTLREGGVGGWGAIHDTRTVR